MSKQPKDKPKDNPGTEIAEVLGPISADGDGIRQALFDEVNLLRAGRVTTGHARALANLVRALLEVARLEIRQRRALEKAVKDRALATDVETEDNGDTKTTDTKVDSQS